MRGLLLLSSMVLLMVLCATGPGAAGVDCEARMYRNAVFTEPQTEFSPYDKIFIVIECDGLRAGPQVMHANWIHEKRGLVRSNKHEFIQQEDGKRSVYFWFKLMRRGPLASTLFNKDFHEENFGGWLVEVYLNDEPILSRGFSITP
ncbi:hypothetical protein [Desulfofustis glycolicus]|uniref:DUF3859 domain-containing protein n=1 Tax=Desulfofustis glycolicus DSM 9705 TaxID=1121409 RepID=A0A1M5VIR4_9BACT|nr:hypothetical protein [Desulfofustis glycolicus]MCB2217615.1 hypothetical protein [Desulfobulbaceae bacterium]SHH75078.1 hypothetical protein SAMN02745124_01723 [Desulfofustis glycolicus DSM 9705]